MAQQISAFPPVPLLTDTPDVFDPKAVTFNLFLANTLQPELNALATEAETNAGTAETKAAEAEGSATAAASSAQDAATSASSAATDAVRAESAVATLPAGTIADAIIAPDKAWSSQKINSLLTLDDRLSFKSDFVRDEHFIDAGSRTFAPAEYVWDVERASPTYALGADGKYRQVASNVLAREWNPETGKYQAQISGAVTNEIVFSTEFSNAAYSKARATITPDTIESPIQGLMASKLTADAVSGTHYIDTPVVTSTSTETCPSVIVKSGEYTKIECYLIDSSGIVAGTNALIDLDLSETDNGFIDDIGGGWKRFYLSNTSNGQNVRLRVLLNDGVNASFTGDGTSGIYIAHAQLVQGTTPGPVIVTEGAPVTRAADNVSRELGAELNGSEGFLIISISIDTSVDAGRVFMLRKSGQSLALNSRFVSYTSSGTFTAEIYSDSAYSGAANMGIAQEGENTIAISWNESSQICCLNGGEVFELSIAAMPLDLLRLTGTGSGAEPRLENSCKLLEIGSKRLTATELQELTQ